MANSWAIIHASTQFLQWWTVDQLVGLVSTNIFTVNSRLNLIVDCRQVVDKVFHQIDSIVAYLQVAVLCIWCSIQIQNLTPAYNYCVSV